MFCNSSRHRSTADTRLLTSQDFKRAKFLRAKNDGQYRGGDWQCELSTGRRNGERGKEWLGVPSARSPANIREQGAQSFSVMHRLRQLTPITSDFRDSLVSGLELTPLGKQCHATLACSYRPPTYTDGWDLRWCQTHVVSTSGQSSSAPQAHPQNGIANSPHRD